MKLATKADVADAIVKLGVERYRLLCFRHRDIRMRAAYSAIVLRKAAGATGQIELTEAELRSTPAGAKIPLGESALYRPPSCGPAGCYKPPDGFHEDDQE